MIGYVYSSTITCIFIFLYLFRIQGTYDYPSLDPSVNSVYSSRPGNLPNPVSTFSTHIGLAKALQERGVGQSIPGWNGLSALSTHPTTVRVVRRQMESPSNYFYNPMELLH